MRIHLKILLLIITATVPILLAACTSVPEAEYKPALDMPEDAHPSPIMFTNLKMAVPAGSDVGTVSDFGFFKPIWFVVPANRHLLRSGISQKEMDIVFSEVMEGQGYDVVDYIDIIFPEEEINELLRTEYRIGAKIIDAKIDADVDHHDRFAGVLFGETGQEGKLWLKIEWGVYDALRRASVYKTVTEGTGELRRANPEGMTLMINAAFEMAAHNLGSDQKFHDLIVSGIRPTGWRKPKKHDDRPMKYDPDEQVTLPAKPLSETPLPQIAKQAQKTAVLVQGGVGHGSGFFISDQGHILTNHHVVGNAQRVRVVTSGKKKKLTAQVLRTHPLRDVALLKLEEIPENLKITPLPIRTEWPAIAEEVYALGAPRSTKLQDTITKGIISAHRKKFRIFGTRIDMIQADVDIHGGNSGGPLLDRHGNIVAINVAGMAFAGPNAGFSTGLNYFIPIGQALDKLDIELESP